MNCEPAYFDRKKCEDNLLGDNCLILKSCCWMNPYAIAEGITIPDKKSKILVCMYHKILSNFSMRNELKIEITEMPKSKDEEENFEVLSTQ